MRRLALILALALTGCGWRMTIHNRNPVGRAPIEYDDKWHSGFIFGMVEASGPYDLSKVCPQEDWSQIHTETPFVQGLVQVLVPFSIYNPQSVTIRCSGP
ncbi:MAG: Bor/Iss family lipoprotein [Myxococcales bacterium]